MKWFLSNVKRHDSYLLLSFNPFNIGKTIHCVVVELKLYLYIYYRGDISSRFSRNFETDASEFLKNIW